MLCLIGVGIGVSVSIGVSVGVSVGFFLMVKRVEKVWRVKKAKADFCQILLYYK